MLETKQKSVEKRIKKEHEDLLKKMDEAKLKELELANKDILPDITKFFRNYALELYGSSVLETEV